MDIFVEYCVMTNITNNQTIDKDQARELYLFSINDGQLYEQTVLPSIKMMQRKIKKGIFDEDLAVQYYSNSFARLALDAYKREFGSIGRMNKATKNAFGQEIFEHLKEQIFNKEVLM